MQGRFPENLEVLQKILDFTYSSVGCHKNFRHLFLLLIIREQDVHFEEKNLGFAKSVEQ